MLTTDVLAFLLQGSDALIKSAAESFTDAEWVERAIPGTNPPGFTAWHMARAVDWAVQCGVRGVPEVAAGDAFAQAGVELGIGTGIGPDEAMAIARRMPRDLVASYSAAVTRASLEWLATAPEQELEMRTQLAQNQAALPVYRAEGHLAEVRELLDIPNWMLLVRPAVSHIRVHYGELQTLSEVFRQG